MASISPIYLQLFVRGHGLVVLGRTWLVQATDSHSWPTAWPQLVQECLHTPGPALGSSGPSPSRCPLPLLPCALQCWQPVIVSELEYRGLKDGTAAQTLGPGEQQDAPLPTLPTGMLLVGCQCVPTHPHVPTHSSLCWGHASSLSPAAGVDAPWLSLALSLPGERLQILGGL